MKHLDLEVQAKSPQKRCRLVEIGMLIVDEGKANDINLTICGPICRFWVLLHFLGQAGMLY